MGNVPSLSFNDWTYVAYSDLCGFKKMMKTREEAYEALNYLFESVFGLLQDRQSVKALAVSDCVISWAEDKQLNSIIDFVDSLHRKMIHKRYLMRTTIAYGQFEFQERIQLKNLSKQMIWGGAYLAAYLGNEKVEVGGIGLLDGEHVPNTEASLRDWRWKKRSRKNETLHEYYWAANSRDDIRQIDEAKRLRREHEQYEGLKDLYSSLVSRGPERMKGKRGKKGKHLVHAKKGLVKDGVWKRTLKNYPTDLVCSIRVQLLKEVPGLIEKFNTNSRYFGYWTGTDKDKDRAYIYVQKKGLLINLNMSRDSEAGLREANFEVRFIDNFQGKAGWLTGWRVPHTTKNIKTVMTWLLKAFNEDK